MLSYAEEESEVEGTVNGLIHTTTGEWDPRDGAALLEGPCLASCEAAQSEARHLLLRGGQPQLGELRAPESSLVGC